MKQLKCLLVIVLLAAMIGASPVLAQEASGNWLKNDGVWSEPSDWPDSQPSRDTSQPSNLISTAGGPVIVQQPQDVSFKIPYPASMSITVENPETCDFQWQWRLHKEGEEDVWLDFEGPGAQRSTLDYKITGYQMYNEIVRCVVTSKSDASKVTVSDPATFIQDGEPSDYYATLGDQIVAMGQTVNLTGGGQARLSSDGKTLTLENANLSYSSDFNSYYQGIGIQYVATADEQDNAVTLELIGENIIYADTEKSYRTGDGIRPSFSGLQFLQRNPQGASTDLMTLKIGGSGQLRLDSPTQKAGDIFDYYGIYAPAFVRLTDQAQVTISNKFEGILCADLVMDEKTALTVAAESSALEIRTLNEAPGNLTLKPEAVLDAKAKMGTVVTVFGNGQVNAEAATIKLEGKMSATDLPYTDDPIIVAGLTTNHPQTADPGAGDVTLKNCQLETSLSTDHQQIQFQQGLKVAGDFVVDGGSVTIDSEILDKAANSRGVIGLQGDNVSFKNGAVIESSVAGSNLVMSAIAGDQMSIDDAVVNTVIDNSAGRFDASETEVVGLGAQHMNINLTGATGRVNAQILGYNNGLPLANYLTSSDTRQDYDPAYQAGALTLAGKAQFIVPAGSQATLNQASLEAHQVLGDPQNKYSVYEATYNKNDTSKAVQQITIADSTPVGTVSYSTQIQNIGWQQAVTNGAISGTTGQALRLEAIKINLDGFPETGSIEYRSHIQNKGWEPGFKSAGEISGTVGEGLRLEAIEIRLTGAMAEKYDVYYQVHAKNFGWLNWAKNGDPAGTEGQSLRLEAIRIQVVPKGTVISSEGTNPLAYVTLADL
ncbi:hypothetical protein LNN31_10175 [Acetobacterium wieringae]|uniref:Clostridial hydrophobic W n=1 Tax=Acetobacterium wieringae TaxID=52694 RepID=A0ABY6H9J2_9FIRM|nr:hypothetical protein [Acetobacterium wieringae]UYO61152.1 hypothetical protein LNN31_10175 [Acetobacterium wieringae]VUZ24445.1 Uncharacterised protein [Acetobacterium wieringae]